MTREATRILLTWVEANPESSGAIAQELTKQLENGIEVTDKVVHEIIDSWIIKNR